MYSKYGSSMMFQGKTSWKEPKGVYMGLRGLSKAYFTLKDP